MACHQMHPSIAFCALHRPLHDTTFLHPSNYSSFVLLCIWTPNSFKSSSISAIASTVHPPHLVACVAVSPKRLRTTSLRLPRRSFVRQYTLHWPDRTAPPCVSAGKCHLHSWKQSAEISLWKTSTSVFYFYIKKRKYTLCSTKYLKHIC